MCRERAGLQDRIDAMRPSRCGGRAKEGGVTRRKRVACVDKGSHGAACIGHEEGVVIVNHHQKTRQRAIVRK